MQYRLTFRVAEPAGPAHGLRPSANSVTDQGLGEESVANGAGNAVLGAGPFSFQKFSPLAATRNA
jgi:hypothetical protein